LVDYFSKEKLIYFFVALYMAVGLLFVYFFYHPSIGVSNLTQSPYRLLGWAYYLFIESYISVMVSLYWAFINDTTTPESAKKGYGILIFGSQLGAVVFILLGNYLSRDPALYAERVPLIALISVVMFFAIAAVAFVMTHVVSREELKGYHGTVEGVKVQAEPKASIGFFEGLKVLLRCPYVGGIFGLVFFHEVVSALMHYQMLRAVELTFFNQQGLVNKFLFTFTLYMQGISCLFALFGTSFFQRRFGVRGCLIAYPVLLGICISFYFINPTLTFIAGVMIIAKGINYVLNQPAKEMLYIPTTRAVKYKAKAWIDMFGLRSAKMGGSIVNKSVGLASRLTASISLVLIMLWIVLSRSVGSHYRRVVKKGDRIGS
jgi:AAA family ATP:ADP antiporter